MKCYSKFWFAVVLSSLLICSIAGAEEKVNTSDEVKTGTPNQDIAYLAVSGELAQIASDSKDAILMLAAARLEAMAVTEELDIEKTSEGDAAETDVESKPEEESLYTLAEQYAGTNEALHTVIAVSRSFAGTKGAVGGAKLHFDGVLARNIDNYTINFYGGELAEIAVAGDGDTDLDLYVYDEYGNQICSDTNWSDRTYCRWMPSWTGSFRIAIENLGAVRNRYRLTTN